MKRIFHLGLAAALFAGLSARLRPPTRRRRWRRRPISATTANAPVWRSIFPGRSRAARANSSIPTASCSTCRKSISALTPAVGRVMAPKADALVKAFRFGLFGPGKSRVVIDLARPACVAKVDSRRLTRDKNASRLTLELQAHAAREAFAAAAQDHAPPPAAPAPALKADAAKPGAPVIVLDPGHGGIDGGAYGLDGAVEKTLVFAFAEALRAKLEATGRYRVVMTRDDDQYVSLEDRVVKARAAEAALFVSIHADTLQGRRERVGHDGLHLLRPRLGRGGRAHRRARERRRPAGRRGAQGGRSRRRRHPVRPQAARDARLRASVLARAGGAGSTEAGGLNHNPERSAGFVVLKAPDFPSVLVELGYLSNAARRRQPEIAGVARQDGGGDARGHRRLFRPSRRRVRRQRARIRSRKARHLSFAASRLDTPSAVVTKRRTGLSGSAAGSSRLTRPTSGI